MPPPEPWNPLLWHCATGITLPMRTQHYHATPSLALKVHLLILHGNSVPDMGRRNSSGGNPSAVPNNLLDESRRPNVEHLPGRVSQRLDLDLVRNQ